MKRKPISKENIKIEINRSKQNSYILGLIKSGISIVLVASALAILTAILWLPVLQIQGSSMFPTLKEKDYVVSVKSKKFKTGDIVAFYYNNKIIVKRVIATEGDFVDIDYLGNVHVNGVYLEEPYIEEKALGESDIIYPYQVPEKSIFVLGDNRSVSIDSRNTQVGCVKYEDVTGKLLFILWPFSDFGLVQY